jgi:hypothetical protein
MSDEKAEIKKSLVRQSLYYIVVSRNVLFKVNGSSQFKFLKIFFFFLTLAPSIDFMHFQGILTLDDRTLVLFYEIHILWCSVHLGNNKSKPVKSMIASMCAHDMMSVI